MEGIIDWISKRGDATKDAGGNIAGKLNIKEGVVVTGAGGEESADRNISLLEGLKINEEDAFKKLQRRRAAEKREKSYTGSISTLNTLLAIKDTHLRKRIATKRIKSLKCTINLFFFLAFIISGFYAYIWYLMKDGSKPTLAKGLVERHVTGTARFEVGVAIWLFLVGFIRLRCPKKEALYYLTQISYLFAVIHYIVLIPLNARNFYKHLSQLEDMMMEEMQLGRCSRIEVVVPSKSKFDTKALVRDNDIENCILETRKLNLPHIRPVTQIECDGDTTWYRKASSLAYDRGDGQLQNVMYEVYSETFAQSQRKQRCCGIKNSKDWIITQSSIYKEIKDAKLFNDSWFIYPESCCKPEWRKLNKAANCYQEHVFGGVCTSDEQVTVITFSLSLLVVLVVCGVLNLTILILLTKYRNLVERFRPDLLQR
ncbi:unnamed protein product [Allacma fusca]|uniref:Uncharacterized protein n=1 Tax=Allacma fusca TaxID=39272 RepID=A0A8J2K3N6_9HEXA|nr:unnamed protein product [Allacma fusca]